ncbi:MAG: hypothetical protein PUC82_04475 [bacterium]|nr:hypothetical protein [bacterium]
MKKKAVLVLTIFGIISIGVGVGINFVYGLKKDQAATLLRMDDVSLEYKNFSSAVDEFNDIRNSLYLGVFENIYYDTMATTDVTVKETLAEYEGVVDKVTKAALELENLCGTIYFPDSNVNSECKSFGSVYEQIVNAFLSDVQLYNDNIVQYNNYQKGNGQTDLLEEYKTDKKYIDYNNDKKYEGKEE